MRFPVLLLAVCMVLPGCFGNGPGDRPEEDSGGPQTGFTMTHLAPGDYETNIEHARLLTNGSHEVLLPEVVDVPASDETPLNIRLTRPDAQALVPTILVASPYFLGFVDDVEFHDGDAAESYERFGEQFVPHGYASVLMALRGTGGSGGCLAYTGPQDAADLDAVIDWAASQPWSNGNVAVIGMSYDGAAAWIAAATGNPHVKSVVPIGAHSDWFSMDFRNGTTQNEAWYRNNVYYANRGLLNHLQGEGGPRNNDLRTPADRMAEHAACDTVAELNAATTHSLATGERDPIGYWEDRDWRDDVLENYEGSVFLVHAFNDVNVFPSQAYPLANQLVEAGSPVKQMLGWWAHEVPGDPDDGNVPANLVRWDWMEILLAWFDHWLKDEPRDLGPAVQVADHRGQWRSDTHWPPTNATSDALYLAADGSLGGSGQAGQVTLTASADCPDCPTFATGALDQEMRFAGQPRLKLHVTPQGSTGFVHAELLQDETLLSYAAMDVRFAAGGETSQPVTPGQTMVMHMQLQPTEATIRAGEKLVLQLSQDRTPGADGSGHPAPIDIHFGESRLIIDTFYVDPALTFEPPT